MFDMECVIETCHDYIHKVRAVFLRLTDLFMTCFLMFLGL